MLIPGITFVEFLRSLGKASEDMTLSSTKSCTFMRESSLNECGDRGVNTDWNCWFNISAFPFVSVLRLPFCFRVGMSC